MKKTLALTMLVCAVGMAPIEIPTNAQDVEQSVVMSADNQIISLVSTASALPPDCDDGIFNVRCIYMIIYNAFGGRDHWFD